MFVVTKKDRFTAEKEAACKFIECLFGEDALRKYGVLIYTCTTETRSMVQNELHHLPVEHLGRKLCDYVGSRVFTVETRRRSFWWWGNSQRREILEEVIAMCKGNRYTAMDCNLLRWERIKQQEWYEFEEAVAPLKRLRDKAKDKKKVARIEEDIDGHRARLNQVLEECEDGKRQWLKSIVEVGMRGSTRAVSCGIQ